MLQLKKEELLICVYCILTLLIPTAVYNKIFFGGLFILWVIKVYQKNIVIRCKAPIVIFLIFTYGFVISFFNKTSFDLAKQFYFACILLFLIYYIDFFSVDMRKVIKISGVFLVIISYMYLFYAVQKYKLIVPGFFLKISQIVNTGIFEQIMMYVEEYGDCAVGYRSFTGNIGVMCHISTIPFILLPICLYWEDFLNKKKISSLLFLLFGGYAVILSTSRALALMVAFVCLFIFVLKYPRFKYAFVLVVVLLGGCAIAYLLKETTMLSMSEESNSTKLGHIKSFFDDISLVSFFSGRGLAAYYYSSGADRCLAHTEITYIDFCRYFGVPLATVVYIVLLFPKKITLKGIWNNINNFIIFGAYLVISMTNPVLFNSMGTIVILWYWSTYLTRRKKNELCNSDCI